MLLFAQLWILVLEVPINLRLSVIYLFICSVLCFRFLGVDLKDWVELLIQARTILVAQLRGRRIILINVFLYIATTGADYRYLRLNGDL